MRCVHLDWFEVCCDETQPLEPVVFENAGYHVEVRPYGTPVYAQMFTILERDIPVYEVRRVPLSKKSMGGIFEDTMLHIRFTNRTCYVDHCIDSFRHFLLRFGIVYRGISRIDICNDFLLFDNAEDPQKVIDDYMQVRISKINQSRVSAHGEDMWDGRSWNSLKWGSEVSAVTTKLYNKTMELERDGHDKPWIRDAWQHAMLAATQWCSYPGNDGREHYRPVLVPYGSQVDGYMPLDDVSHVTIWRVEFSVKSQGRNFINTDDGTRLSIDLTTIDTIDKLVLWFHILAGHYFHFKQLIRRSDGSMQRKDRCPDVPLFRLSSDTLNFHPLQLTSPKRMRRTERLVCRKLYEVSEDWMTYTKDERSLCSKIASKMLYVASQGNVDLSDHDASSKNLPNGKGGTVVPQLKFHFE